MMVLGFGALNLDFIYEVEDLSFLKCKGLNIEPGSEIVLDEQSFPKFFEKITRFGVLRKVCPGGSAANTCHMLSLMGVSTCIFGILGLDKEGDYYISKLVPNSESIIIRRGKTGVTYILNEKNKSPFGSDRAIILFPNSNSEIKKDDLDMKKISSCSWIHMSSFVTESAIQAQIYVKEALKGRIGFSLDPGEIYASMGEIVLKLLQGIDILFCSEKELCNLFGSDLQSSLADALKLVKMVILKRGREGASFYTEKKVYHVKSEKIKATDTTGAGDVLNGVFLGLFLKGYDPFFALEKAVFAASESIKGYGRDNYPRYLGEEV
ncbi:MAG: carbohydrate kinase family protein [Deltaproteobacteria bacterium]|nr:carbohydrate kinase family protein [Deltaproteobacteria bacterium]